MIDVEHVRDATHGPGRVRFTPNGLAQGERRLQRGRRAEKDHEAREHARVVINHGGQPRSLGVAVGVKDQQVQLRMIGLPETVGSLGAMSKDQFKAVPISGRAVMCQGDHGRIEAADD